MQGRYWNIMEGVRESLCRRTQQEEQSRKQSMATGTRQPKQVCQEHIPSVSIDGLFRRSITADMGIFLFETTQLPS
jgi:hypothetical protein